MKFKNTDWKVFGNKHIVKAFYDTLKDKGLTNIEMVNDFYLGLHYCCHSKNNSDYAACFKLPKQYTEALEYATEKEQKLEVGKWSISKNYLLCYTGGNKSYGFDLSNGQWCDDYVHDYNMHINSNYSPATKEEVEKALIAEAKRRGFKRGVRYKSYPRTLHDGSKSPIVEDEVKRMRIVMYDTPKETSLLNNGNHCIFYNGKWAEVLAEQDKVPVITVNGTDYKMEVRGDYIKFGCAEFDSAQLDFVDNAISVYNKSISIGYGNRAIKSITLDSGVEITVEKLKEIKEYLDS